MSGLEFSPTFYKAIALVVFWLIGQATVEWVKLWMQKTVVKSEWTGAERRQVVEIDEMLVKQFLETYKKHVDFVGVMSSDLKLSAETLRTIIQMFREHDTVEAESQVLIRQIHARGKPA